MHECCGRQTSRSAPEANMVIRRRLDLSGPGLVFLTTTAKDHFPVFEKKQLADIVISQLGESVRIFRVSLVGYCLMPSHLHLILGFPKIEELSRFMQSFKSLSSRKIYQFGSKSDELTKKIAHTRNVWSPRFDDVIIFSEKQFRIKLDYIHNNPVKAGLAKSAVEWEYSIAVDWLDDKDGLLEIDKEFSWL